MSKDTVTYRLSKQRNVISTQTNILLDLWSNKMFCDVTVIVEDEKFEVHKIILASHIPYFREMFSNDKYQECNAAEIKLSDLDPQIMSFILDYIYGRVLQITKDNIIKILHHADYLMMNDLKDWCEEQLMSATSDETCIEYFLLSRRYKLPRLNDKTKLYFDKNLDNIYSEADFLTLSKEEFSEIWSLVKDGKTAYLALMKWTKYDPDNRKGMLHELLEKIPQDGFTVDFFKDIIAKDLLLKENHQCCVWLVELATLLLNTPATPNSLANWNSYESDSD